MEFEWIKVLSPMVGNGIPKRNRATQTDHRLTAEWQREGLRKELGPLSNWSVFVGFISYRT